MLLYILCCLTTLTCMCKYWIIIYIIKSRVLLLSKHLPVDLFNFKIKIKAILIQIFEFELKNIKLKQIKRMLIYDLISGSAHLTFPNFPPVSASEQRYAESIQRMVNVVAAAAEAEAGAVCNGFVQSSQDVVDANKSFVDKDSIVIPIAGENQEHLCTVCQQTRVLLYIVSLNIYRICSFYEPYFSL